ncbi:MAG: MBL fold metallo-hydrolase [Anaeromyxobacter sp. RBG_16_69_14]|nr:MAG: MBL fold metallo-hydrolase [Anaeromyxobacter sp. RBG_16_69_14]
MKQSSALDILEIRPDIYWIGTLHPELRIFDDLFPTRHGTTYNSYLLKGAEKTAIIDTVKGKFGPEFMGKVRQLVGPNQVDYIVVNHTEPDHSGSLSLLLKHSPRATVVCTQTAATFLGNLYHSPFSLRVVKHGEVLDLGGKHLRFFSAPFLHWPDTMFTLLEEANVLFTCDAFGAHYCGDSMFNDEVPDLVLEMKFYFDCLMRPFKDKVLSAVEKIRNEKIDIICPSHGPVLRSNPMQAVALYERWSRPSSDAQDSHKKIVILYLSPHGNTRLMSEAVAEGGALPGVEVIRCHINDLTENELRDQLEQADALIFGVPTINRDAPKPMWEVLANLSAVKLRTTIAGVFGSYGWSGEGCKMTEDRLKGLKFDLPVPFVQARFTPRPADLARCRDLGRSIAGKLQLPACAVEVLAT